MRGEKVDIIRYDATPATFIMNALAPAKVIGVELFEDDGVALVIVPDYQLSLAIGRDGQNVRLAARLTGWRLDIASESESAAARERYLAERAERATAEATPAEAVEVSEESDERPRISMRNSSASSRSSAASDLAAKKAKPVRTCVGCRGRFAQRDARAVRARRERLVGRCDRDAEAGNLAGARTSARTPCAARDEEQTLPGSWRRCGRMWFNRKLVQTYE